MSSEREAIPKGGKNDSKDTNGEKNGNSAETLATSGNDKEKLSLGEIAAIDGEIAKAKTDQLQLLHNLFYDKNGTGPQIKRNIRKFAGFEESDKQKKLDQLLTFDIQAIKQTSTILAIQDIKKDDTKEIISSAIIDFLMAPTGKTFEEFQKDEPEDEEKEEEGEAEDEEDDEEEEEQEIKSKPKKGRGSSNSAGRPKRATASRVWTNDYGSSEDEEIEEARPRVGRKKRGGDSDSGSDYNPSGGGSDSEGDRRKSSRNSVPTRPTRGGRGRRGRGSESEEESEEESEDFSEEEVVPAKKKKNVPNRSTPKRGAAQRGRKRKQETESEEEPSEEDEEEEMESDDSEKQKKTNRKSATPKSSLQKKASKGRPKRAAPTVSKKKRKVASSDEEEPEDMGESEDDEPLKKPPKRNTSEDGTPTDDEIKKLLKDILAEANLEEITMKTVCKKVYAHYPNHDLSQRKDFIKQTVKSLIAA
ncbi:CLUMA_CG020917, isoform A [Clunio marinus]|uniref:CLUMA_CG020917, isoform A n=1 Tax=Clunio marinus TaxID=568069 RepID=A0A1J1JA87_9DIPT|nr:CLUMA_CG020917, isoform A [Clunio marinus]